MPKVYHDSAALAKRILRINIGNELFILQCDHSRTTPHGIPTQSHGKSKAPSGIQRQQASRSSNLQLCCSISDLFEWDFEMAFNDDLIKRLRELSTTITTIRISSGQCARELDLLIEIVSRLDRHSPPNLPDRLHVGQFVVDRTTFSVSDGSRVCELGNTVRFRFFEILAREPNRSFTHTQLLAGVWDGRRCTASTVRSAVFELRSRLRKAGLDELALAIRAHGKAYSLRFEDLRRSTQQKSNG